MTNKEDIEQLLTIKKLGCLTDKDRQALNRAIKALEERPKGEWIEGGNGNIKCNKCGSEFRYSYLIGNNPDFPKFCCECGADMRGDEE